MHEGIKTLQGQGEHVGFLGHAEVKVASLGWCLLLRSSEVTPPRLQNTNFFVALMLRHRMHMESWILQRQG